MKFESLDRILFEIDIYWVVIVVMLLGFLFFLRYDGYDDDRSGDFWCDVVLEDF